MNAAAYAQHWANDIGKTGYVTKRVDPLEPVTQVERLVLPR
jgi:hypothetical protein